MGATGIYWGQWSFRKMVRKIHMEREEIQMKNSSEFWGTYKGYNVYKCYSNAANESLRDRDSVYVDSDGLMWYRGVTIGEVTSRGDVQWFKPERAEEKKVSKKSTVAFKETPVVENKDLDEVLKRALSRSLEELVGPKLAEYKD